MLGGLVSGLVILGVAGAGPALAVDDPTRPDARVTHGPSCRSGGVVVEVTAGTVPYAVVLATTRRPGGEATAELAAGETVALRTGDVDWGETIDSRLEYTALDGSGTAYVDELESYSFTRPTEEDCAAIAAPAEATVPPATGTSEQPAGGGTLDVPAASGTDPVPMPEVDVDVDPAPAPTPQKAAPAPAASVAAGATVTLTASGFGAGERVTLWLEGGTELGTFTADEEGLVAADVQIPAGTAVGATTLEMVGAESSTTVAVDLHIASHSSPIPAEEGRTWWPALLAGGALLVASGGLLACGARRRDPGAGTGSA